MEIIGRDERHHGVLQDAAALLRTSKLYVSIQMLCIRGEVGQLKALRLGIDVSPDPWCAAAQQEKDNLKDVRRHLFKDEESFQKTARKGAPPSTSLV
ncbi:hypothetical protein EJB05_18353, partial [Eragrostis curvula]